MTLSGHVVVCGLHDDGLRVVEQLHHAGVPLIVVDERPDPRLPPVLEALGVRWLEADMRSEATLWEAGLAEATALVCVARDDLVTLATALLARELRPELRIVVALSNPAVGRAVGDIGVAVLDAAAIAAPSVVEACLQTTVRPLPVGEREFLVVNTPVPRPATLRELYGDLAPLAVVHEGRVVVSPGRDHHAEPDDTVVLVGEAQGVQLAGLVPRAAPVVANAGARGGGAARDGASASRQMNLARYAFRRTDPRVKRALAALATLMTLSVTVLTLGYQEPNGTRMSVLDGIYFTVETIGTVGYGDFYFRDQPSWLRLWAILLMVVGATLATVFFALLTNSLISRTLAGSFGQRRVTGLVDHVVVVGAGSVGIAVAEGLVAAGAEVVVVEADEHNRFLGQLRALGVPVVIADATVQDTWAAVRLGHARAVAVMTSSDLANIETGLAVRDLLGERWHDVPVVLRLFDRRLAETVESGFDFQHVRSPSALAAPWFVGAALGLDVVSTLYVAGRPMLVARLVVPERLDGTAMRDLSFGTLVVSLQRKDGSVLDLPRRDATFGLGDVATLVGPYEELLLLLLG